MLQQSSRYYLIAEANYIAMLKACRDNNSIQLSDCHLIWLTAAASTQSGNYLNAEHNNKFDRRWEQPVPTTLGTFPTSRINWTGYSQAKIFQEPRAKGVSLSDFLRSKSWKDKKIEPGQNNFSIPKVIDYNGISFIIINPWHDFRTVHGTVQFCLLLWVNQSAVIGS